MSDDLDAPVVRLLPAPQEELNLEGLYLREQLRELGTRDKPFVYGNYVTSLDGRISLFDADSGYRKVPKAIANPRDWRLFHELVAHADVLITSGSYLRDLAADQAQDILSLGVGFDALKRWRTERGLPPEPAVAVLSASLDFPPLLDTLAGARKTCIITGREADPARRRELERRGIPVLIAGRGRQVEGGAMIRILNEQGHAIIYSATGPQGLHTVLAAGMLDRLYITIAHRLIGGAEFDTLVQGPALQPAPKMRLGSLYYDAHGPEGAGQFFTRFEREDWAMQGRAIC